MPRNVRRFELLIYLSLILNVAIAPLEFERMAPLVGSKLATVVGMALQVVLICLLIWMAARRRDNWARWGLLVLYVVSFLPLIAEWGKTSALVDGLNVVDMSIGGVALFFGFTGDSRPWFTGGAARSKVWVVVISAIAIIAAVALATR